MIESINRKEITERSSTIAKNLKELMKLNDISSSTLANSIGLPYNTIRRLLTGETTDPKYSTLVLLSEFFSVPIGYIAGEKGSQPHMIPIFSWEQISQKAILEIERSNWTDWAPISLAEVNEIGKNAYALKSRKSMQPRIPNGTLMIIDPDSAPIDGDLVLIKMKDSKQVSLRDLVIDPPSWFLQPLTQQSTSLTFNKKNHEVIGVVVLTLMYNR